MEVTQNKFFNSLLTLGQKMSTQRHLAAISAGMMSSMPFMLLGAIFQIITAIPGALSQMGVHAGFLDFISENSATILIPYEMTSNLFSIVVAFAIAYRLAASYKMKAMMNGAVSFIIFLMVAAPTTTVAVEGGGSFAGLSNSYLGGQGLFVAMLVACLSVEITRFCVERNITIRMPDMVPPALSESFNAVIPLFMNTLVFQGINWILGATLEMTLPQAIMKVLAAPLGAVNSAWGMLFLIVFALVLWLFGIHGTIIVYPFMMPMAIMAAQHNAGLIAQGLDPIFFPSALFGAVQIAGGTGCTLGLVILALRSKSEQLKAVSKAALIPGWCGINEPVAFGFPTVLNPVLAIPYILAPVACFFLQWGAYVIGFIKPGYMTISGLMPMGLSSFLSSGMNIGNLIFPYLLIPVTMLIYFPFYKAYEAQLVKKEAEAAAQAQAE